VVVGHYKTLWSWRCSTSRQARTCCPTSASQWRESGTRLGRQGPSNRFEGTTQKYQLCSQYQLASGKSQSSPNCRRYRWHRYMLVEIVHWCRPVSGCGTRSSAESHWPPSKSTYRCTQMVLQGDGTLLWAQTRKCPCMYRRWHSTCTSPECEPAPRPGGTPLESPSSLERV